MPVQIQYSTGLRPLTPDYAVKWAGQEGRQFLADNTTRSILPMFIANWNQTYDSSEHSMFLSHLEMYVDQIELLRGVRDLGVKIQNDYPVQAYLYVGIGRSPAPLIAYFQNIRIRTQTIPLSSFRPRNANWSITDAVLSSDRIASNQQQALFLHFAQYFPGPPVRHKVLLIDYTQSAQSLVAAQEQLQLFFQSRQQNIEVHALALCRDSDEPTARNIGVMVGTTRKPFRNPVDWWSFSGQRQSFAQRWHVLPIAMRGQNQTRRQRLVMSAFSGQTFDDLAEYGSFPILTQDLNIQPTRYTNNPNEPAAYNVLRDALRST